MFNTKKSIVIIEDNEYYSKLIQAKLLNMGYKNIKIFNNGEDALQYINKNETVCIILDYILSNVGLNGDSVLKKIKKIRKNSNVIMLSGQEDIKTATDLMKNGAYDYIVKNDMAFFNLQNSLRSLVRLSILERNKMGIIYLIISLIIFISSLFAGIKFGII